MTLPIVDTPIGPVPAIPERTDRWNPELEAALYPSSHTRSITAKLADPRALVVTTGQQPGLLTGPSYAITKALSARGLALALERRWNRPVVPVYWVPGDDHDWQEASSVHWIAFDGSAHTASLPARPPEAALTPMWREPLGPAVLSVLDAFQQSFSETPERQATIGWLRRHYTPASTVSAAYGNALAELLGPLGILCLDSTHGAVKRAATPLLLEALRRSHELDHRLAVKDRALKEGGIDAGVAVGDGASLVFLEAELGRDRLVPASDGRSFQLRRARTTIGLESLVELAEKEPTRLSANVLLRPVLESTLLPTVAYLAGPAELKYLELAAPIYETLGAVRQVPVPRWSGLLVEPRVTRVLNKYGIGIEELVAETQTEMEQHIQKRGEELVIFVELVDVSQDVIISEHDCGTVDGIEIRPIIESGEVIEPLRDRIVGRVSLENIKDPFGGQVIVKINEQITEEKANEVQAAGIDKVKIRSVLTCESVRGVCALCYGRDLATGKLLMEAPGRLSTSPNGHGGALTALAEQGLLELLRKRGIEELFYFQVDNPMVKVAEPVFLGHHRAARAEVSTKVVEKVGPTERTGNLVCVDGRCVFTGACASDAECPASDVCGSGRCVEGGCIYPDGVFACPEGEACHPARGCVSASCECDDADPCTVDSCALDVGCINTPRQCPQPTAACRVATCDPKSGCGDTVAPDGHRAFAGAAAPRGGEGSRHLDPVALAIDA